MKKFWMIISSVMIMTCSIFSATVYFAWDHNLAPDVIGYNIHYGNSSRIYTNLASFGNVTNGFIGNLMTNAPYFFAATAVTSNGLESRLSIEVSCNTSAASNVFNSLPNEVQDFKLLKIQ